MDKSINGRLREYFADIAGIDHTVNSTNTCIRQGLEALGFSGSINKMLKDWAIDVSGGNSSFNTASTRAFVSSLIGESSTSWNTAGREFFGGVLSPETANNWENLSVAWEDEDRLWENIN